MRAIFFGSPAFAVPSLEALHEISEIVGVVCQPDKPRGRGLDVAAPAVKVRATELGLPVAQPTKLRTGEVGAWVAGLQPDVALVVAYGRLLPADVLAAPRLGCVNVHASLLPKYRGAAPIAWAIVRGETETGITLMQLDDGMDTGPTFARVVAPIGPEESAGELSVRLSRLGADAVRRWVPELVAGRCVLEPQDESLATLAPLLKKEDGLIAFAQSAEKVRDHVRGMSPWPGAYTTTRNRSVKVHAARSVEVAGAAAATPGLVLVADKSRLLVACGQGAVDLVTVQPEGKRAMSGVEWVMGRGVAEGDVLGG